MKVVIVSKTNMGGLMCVGGLTLDDNRNVRLLQPDAWNQPRNTAFAVGDLWDLNFRPRREVVAPHTEDILVYSGRKLGQQDNLRDFLLSRVKHWQGGPEHLFDGLIRFTHHGTGYIGRKNVLPDRSVGFWVPSVDLARMDEPEKTRYKCQCQGKDVWITYVGFEPAIELITHGSLVRVSLARWWRPDDDSEERCYLQLSGWYDVAQVTQPVRSSKKNSRVCEDDIPY